VTSYSFDQDPDCMGFLKSDCSIVDIPIVNLSDSCHKQPQEPKFLSSENTNEDGDDVKLQKIMTFAAFIGIIVLVCVALTFFLQRRARKIPR